MNNIPFFGKDRYYKEHSKDILDIVHSVYSHGMVVMGPEVNEFEKKIAEYCGRKYGVAVGSCTDALYFSLLDKNIGSNDEVLVTGYSFIASASCIAKIGAKPVFVDINPENYMMNLDDLKKKITRKTKAIIAVHLFGNSLDMDSLEKIAEEHNLVIIEDAAQSIGSSFKGRKVGTLGSYSCISFDPTKILSAQSNGGIILTDDISSYKRLSEIRYHGKCLESGDFKSLGFNSRISSLQARLLNYNLDLLDSWIEKNRKIAQTYKTGLSNLNELILPEENENTRHVFHKFVLKVKNGKRNELKNRLSENGIKTMIHYEKALHENQMFSSIEHSADNLKNINNIKSEVLSLPIHPWLAEEEVFFVVEEIKKFFNK